jgi:hypothetical protein
MFLDPNNNNNNSDNKNNNSGLPTESSAENTAQAFFSNSTNRYAVIAGCVAFVILLLGAIICIVVIRHKRRRQDVLPTTKEKDPERALENEYKDVNKKEEYFRMPKEVIIEKNDYKAQPKKQNNSKNDDLDIDEDYIVEYSAIKREQKIGEGATGTVYKGQLHFADVAVKEINLSVKSATATLGKEWRSFLNEVAMLNKMTPHPNVVRRDRIGDVCRFYERFHYRFCSISL